MCQGRAHISVFEVAGLGLKGGGGGGGRANTLGGGGTVSVSCEGMRGYR